MTRRTAWVLIAAGAWSLYVWISRVAIMSGQNTSVGFKVVHYLLAVISIGFGVAVGLIGLRAWRTDRAERPPRS
jgi:hypothetical protein